MLSKLQKVFKHYHFFPFDILSSGYLWTKKKKKLKWSVFICNNVNQQIEKYCYSEQFFCWFIL